MSRLVVVQAAAGCGKTTALARHALGLVSEGLPLERIVAITFTRRAAAELHERLAAALRACLPGEAGERARAELGAAWPAYAEVAPSDPEVARRALAELPHAPVGTTDRFVQDLLTECALDAFLPLPDGERLLVDVPVRAVASVEAHVEAAARRLLDPPDGRVHPDVAMLCEHLTLDEVLAALCRRGAHDDLPVADGLELLRDVARALAILLGRHPIGGPADPADASAWEALLIGLRAAPGDARAIAAWCARGAGPDDAPPELVPWAAAMPDRRDTRPLRDALRRATFELGVARVRLIEVVELARPPWHEVARWRRADALRAALDRLRRRARADGLRRAARAGELDHDALTRAAIALCEDPPPRLHGRYRALLVDEVQDADPTQLALYAALAALPGPEPVRAFYVGDARQSIYLFREAEPSGLAELTARAAEAGSLRALGTNHRASPALVEAQRAMFAALVEPAAKRGLRAPDPLDGVEAHPGNERLALDPARHDPPEPVWLVRGGPGESLGADAVDRRALFAFLERLRAAWLDGDDTAAVLAPTWARAREACDLLRRWAGDPAVASVEGGRGDPDARPLVDLRALLAALLDPDDEIAWLAVWRHPAVGLSDAGIARVRAGLGLPDGASRGFGRLVDVPELLPPHDAVDRLAHARAAPWLRAARDGLGRREAASLLDELVDGLGWRAVYAAGPGGDDDVVLLEVLLEHLRALSVEGHDPEALLATLRGGGDDLPSAELDRPARHVTCTTVFQAKGRAWDHVMLWSPGRPARVASAGEADTWARRPGRDRARLTGFAWDPEGGLSPELDPVGRLADAVVRRRFDDEGLRMAYVGLSRARRSVTLGLPDRARRLPTPQALLAECWGDLQAPGVVTVRRPAPPEPPPLPPGWAAPRPGAPTEPSPVEARRWRERAPSSLGRELPAERRRQRAEWIASHVALSGGLHRGGPAADPPPREGVAAAAWGELAHAWLAAWAFRGLPEAGDVAGWLRAHAGADDPEVGAWLVALSRGLAAHGGPLWALVTDPAARLRFEVPLVGVDGDLLLSGRIDLLVERRSRLTVVDFKAGGRAPTDREALLELLADHGAQLEAYRAALAGMGLAVDGVALWFVRTGASVRW